MLSALDRHYFEPLVVFTEKGPILDFARKLNIPVKVIPMHSVFFYSAYVPLRLRTLWSFVRYYRQTIKEAKKLIEFIKPDIVHLNTSVLIPVAIGVKKFGIPIIWHIREAPGPNKIIQKWQISMIKKLADGIIVNSNYVKGFYSGGPAIQTIHNAVDLELFNIDVVKAFKNIRSEFRITKNATVICMIGAVQKVKGHFLLVEAAKKIVQHRPNSIFMVIAGGVDEKYINSWKGKIKRFFGLSLDNLQKMERLISKLNLEKNFIITGYRRDIPELLAASDITVFLSQKAEGFGRPLIEGMAMSKPIVATNIGPAKEILGEGTGILVPVGDINNTAKAIITLIDSQVDRIKMGKKGFTRVQKKFALKKHVSDLKHFIDTVLKIINN